ALLGDERLCERIRANAYREVQERFNWDTIAEETIGVYEKVLEAYRASPWAVTGPRWFAHAVQAPPDYARYLVPESVH
ncbi:MAG: hypothetical protein AB1700_16180, partial [Bacillota bacterium]